MHPGSLYRSIIQSRFSTTRRLSREAIFPFILRALGWNELKIYLILTIEYRVARHLSPSEKPPSEHPARIVLFLHCRRCYEKIFCTLFICIYFEYIKLFQFTQVITSVSFAHFIFSYLFPVVLKTVV